VAHMSELRMTSPLEIERLSISSPLCLGEAGMDRTWTSIGPSGLARCRIGRMGISMGLVRAGYRASSVRLSLAQAGSLVSSSSLV